MTPQDTATIVAYIAKVYPTPTDHAALTVWHDLIGQLDAGLALGAVKKLMAEPRDFGPKPGHIIAACRVADGTQPPSLDAAVGFYLTGHWDVHPAVNRAAKGVHWDRINAEDKAKWQFRSLYEAELYREEGNHVRGEIGHGQDPQPISAALNRGRTVTYT